jgi:hypothetical protein
LKGYSQQTGSATTTEHLLKGMIPRQHLPLCRLYERRCARAAHINLALHNSRVQSRWALARKNSRMAARERAVISFREISFKVRIISGRRHNTHMEKEQTTIKRSGEKLEQVKITQVVNKLSIVHVWGRRAAPCIKKILTSSRAI